MGRTTDHAAPAATSQDPTFSGRVGYRPNAALNIGANGSFGGYLLPSAKTPAVGLNNFKQITFGPDISYAWHHWNFWAEAMASRFEVPFVGNADTVAYYVESRYQFTPQFFGAPRWNQQLFDDVPNGAGGKEAWDRDIFRIDAALGYRFTRHIQTIERLVIPAL